MKSSELKTVIVEQNSLPLETRLISRDKFRQVVQWHSDAAVVVISGLRRCGKSTLLAQLRDTFKGYYLNFDDERLVLFTTSKRCMKASCTGTFWSETKSPMKQR